MLQVLPCRLHAASPRDRYRDRHWLPSYQPSAVWHHAIQSRPPGAQAAVNHRASYRCPTPFCPRAPVTSTIHLHHRRAPKKRPSSFWRTNPERPPSRQASETIGLGIKLKLYISFFQVVSQMGKVYHFEYPPSYSQFLKILGFANGEFFSWIPNLSMRCVGLTTLYDQLFVITLLPPALIATIFAASYARFRSAVPLLPYALTVAYLVSPYCASLGFRILDQCDCFKASDGGVDCFSQVDYALRCPAPMPTATLCNGSVTNLSSSLANGSTNGSSCVGSLPNINGTDSSSFAANVAMAGVGRENHTLTHRCTHTRPDRSRSARRCPRYSSPLLLPSLPFEECLV